MRLIMRTGISTGMTEDEFFRFCQDHDTLNFERNARGEIIVLMPTGSQMGSFNAEINRKLGNWNEEKKLGKVFDSNAGFTLPNGAVRSPDAAFITNDRWSKVSKEDRRKFAHICPDFVIEIQSESDDSNILQDKMNEWIENGCQLAWLIDPEKKETRIYRPKGKVEVKSFETLLDGENVLPGFSIDLQKVFSED